MGGGGGGTGRGEEVQTTGSLSASHALVPYKSAVDPVIVHGFYCLLIGLGPRMETRRSGCSTSQNSPSCFVLPLCVDGVAQISCL